MFYRERLRDGSLRLRSETCRFVFTRLRPGVVLVSIFGPDSGEFGAAPFEELEAELQRFGQPLELFVDTRATARVPGGVTDAWTSWFVRHQGSLTRVSILVGSKAVQLAVSMVQHFSRTGGLMTIYTEPAEFQQAIGRATPGFVALPSASVASEPAIVVQWERLPDGTTHLWSDRCRFTFRRVGPGALLLEISGSDSGELGSLPIDEAAAILSNAGTPVELFVDTSRVVSTTDRVAEEWTAWFLGNQHRLRKIHLLTGSQVLHLQITIASYLTRSSRLMSLHRDPEAFRRAMSR